MAEAPAPDVPCRLCGSTDRTVVESHRGDPYRAPGSAAITVVCHRCGLVYASPQPTAADLEELYAGEYGGVRSGGPDSFYLDRKDYDATLRLEFIRRQVPGEHGRALEIGAGAGNLLAALKRDGWDVVGIEPTPAYAAYAREALGVPVSEGFFDEGAFEPQSFDLVIMAEVLEHFPDPLAALRSIRHVLRPQGHLYLDVPNTARPNRFRLSEYLHGDHLTFFSPTTLPLMLRATGFRPIAHRWHYYQYLVAEVAESEAGIDFAAEGEDYRDVIRRLHRPRPYLLLTFAKRSLRNALIRLLGGRVGAALLRRAVAVRNRLRGW